jgi:hypothetical protein
MFYDLFFLSNIQNKHLVETCRIGGILPTGRTVFAAAARPCRSQAGGLKKGKMNSTTEGEQYQRDGGTALLHNEAARAPYGTRSWLTKERRR